MTIRSILFDLDDTLVVEGASADAAFPATCERARAKHSIDPDLSQMHDLLSILANAEPE